MSSYTPRSRRRRTRMRCGWEGRTSPIYGPITVCGRHSLVRGRRLVRRWWWTPAIRLHRTTDPLHSVPLLLLHLPLQLMSTEKRTYAVWWGNAPIAVPATAECKQHEQAERTRKHLEHDGNRALAVRGRRMGATNWACRYGVGHERTSTREVDAVAPLCGVRVCVRSRDSEGVRLGLTGRRRTRGFSRRVFAVTIRRVCGGARRRVS